MLRTEFSGSLLQLQQEKVLCGSGSKWSTRQHEPHPLHQLLLWIRFHS
jgi:hypothetical protein